MHSDKNKTVSIDVTPYTFPNYFYSVPEWATNKP